MLLTKFNSSNFHQELTDTISLLVLTPLILELVLGCQERQALTYIFLLTRSHARPTNKSRNNGTRAQFVSPRTLTVARRLQPGCGRPRSRGDRDRNVDRSEATVRRPQSSRLQEAGLLRCIGTARVLKVSSGSSSSSGGSVSSSSFSSSSSSRTQTESSIVLSCPIHS